MKSSRLFIILGIAVCGFFTGSFAKRMGRGNEVSSSAPEPKARDFQPGRPDRSNRRDRTESIARIDTSFTRSTDTLDTLKAVPATELYSRLSLWMIDASKEDVAAYWRYHQSDENKDYAIGELILVNWTRLDPQGAIAAVAGTQDEPRAWTAWASSDPIGALTAVLEQNPRQLDQVTMGIGEFHPDWLMEHFDDIPSEGRSGALQGLAKWDDVEDPAKVLTFLSENGFGLQPKILMLLITRDPWAAYDWVQKNGSMGRNNFGPQMGAFDTFAKTIGEQDPELLQRFADQAPPGEMKQQLDAALFHNLVKSDPEAARKQALFTESPTVRSERMAEVVEALVHQNPDLAFSTVEELLQSNPNALQIRTTIQFGDGSTSMNHPAVNAIDGMITNLVGSDPERLMNLVMAGDSEDFYSSTLYLASRRWVANDLDAYADWADRQTDPKISASATNLVINQLNSSGRYEEAAFKGLSLAGDSPHSGSLTNTLLNWSRAAPEEAMEWLEQSGLPQEKIEAQKDLINRRR